MNYGAEQIAGRPLYVWLTVLLGLAVALGAGIMVGTDAIRTVIVLSVLTASISWIILAKKTWWVLLPAAGTLGGYFYFGHKIYTNEVAFLACLVPLGMARAVRAPGIIQHRTFRLPAAVYFLAGYLFLHWVASNIYNKLEGTGGYGNVTRAYFTPLSAVIFVFLFKNYGASKYVGLALLINYFAAGFRVIVGMATYFTNGFAYVPVINYVLPGSTHTRGDDLRASGLSLAGVALCYLLMKKGAAQKSFHLAVFLGSCVALALGGGRGVMVIALAMVLFAAVLYRKAVPLVLALFLTVTSLVVVNAKPAVLNPLPNRVQRTLSILLLSRDEAARYGQTEGSDLWHEDLRALGYNKWTESWNTFLFGTGIRPYDFALAELGPSESNEKELIESAAKVGAYESGWWTVLAVTGLVGFVLYLIVLLYLLGKLFPILWKDKVVDYAHAFAFLVTFGIINWVTLGWANGSFPAGEIMFGFLAIFALNDQMHARNLSEDSEKQRHNLPSFGRTDLVHLGA